MGQRTRVGRAKVPSQVVVRLVCAVVTIVTCEGCTEAEARADPFKYAVDTRYDEITDWTVTSTSAR